jgi:hypothetical protein
MRPVEPLRALPVAFYLLYFSNLKMETVSSSEKWINFYQTIGRRITEHTVPFSVSTVKT